MQLLLDLDICVENLQAWPELFMLRPSRIITAIPRTTWHETLRGSSAVSVSQAVNNVVKLSKQSINVPICARLLCGDTSIPNPKTIVISFKLFSSLSTPNGLVILSELTAF